MASISLNGIAYSSLDLAFAAGADTPTAGTYYVLPPYGDPPSETARKYDDLVFSFPAVDGMGIKRLGFRGRLLRVQLLIADTTKAETEGRHNTLCGTLDGLLRYTVILPGGTTRPGYRLIPGAVSQQWLPSIGSKFICLDTINLLQCSEA